ncbi:MAG: TIGR01244 family sulfur transferase [Rhizobiaceae bacterium]|nr:TIGR01244 family sulfur transferase [Rhizobiaceae bacterium]
MNPRQISEDYTVSPQISVEDVQTIKDAGFKSVICNRPDNEDPGQVSVEAIRNAVEAAGLAFRHVPVVSGQMTVADVEAQAEALEGLEGPVFAYCRSGTRSANLYAGVQQLKG